jgi:hypothetical protein
MINLFYSQNLKAKGTVILVSLFSLIEKTCFLLFEFDKYIDDFQK